VHVPRDLLERAGCRQHRYGFALQRSPHRGRQQQAGLVDLPGNEAVDDVPILRAHLLAHRLVLTAMRAHRAVSAACLVCAAMSAAPGSAQEVTFPELQGAIIESRIFRTQVIKSNGKRYSRTRQSDVRIVVGPGDLIQRTQIFRWHSNKGASPPIIVNRTGKLGRAWPNPSLGGGYSAYVLMNSTLTYLRHSRKAHSRLRSNLSARRRAWSATPPRFTYKRQAPTKFDSTRKVGGR